MLRLGRLLSALALLFAFVCVGVGGSSPAGESRSGDSGIETPHLKDVGANVASLPFPSGGTPLLADRQCPRTSTHPDRASLQRGMASVTSRDWRSSDGGLSTPLGDGRVMWLFGDTSKMPGAVHRGMVSNSVLISSGACFAQWLPQAHGSVIPDDGTGRGATVTWPTAVFSVDRGTWTEVYVFGNRVKRQWGFWGFTLLGSNVSRFAVPRNGAPKLLDVRQLTEDDASPEHTTWGTGCVVHDGWVYVYGTKVVAGSLGREVLVARTRIDEVAQPSRWEFKGTQGWGAEALATPVLSATPGVSHIISVFSRGASWYVVSKAGGDLGPDVGVWKASGPAADFQLAGRTPQAYKITATQVRYMPLAHPEYAAGNTMVVSMSRNVTGGPEISHNYALGRPEFFTIPLP